MVQVHDAIARKRHPRIAGSLAWKAERVVTRPVLKLWEPLWQNRKRAAEGVGGCSGMQVAGARAFGSCVRRGVLKRCGREGGLVLDRQFLLNQVC